MCFIGILVIVLLTIQIINCTTSKLLEKCSKEDVDGLQAYTIRRMDEKLPVGLDCDHYKMMTVQESPLDSRQSFLDALCFPVLLFPSGRHSFFDQFI